MDIRRIARSGVTAGPLNCAALPIRPSSVCGKGRSRRLNTARVRPPRNFDVVAELAAARVDKCGGRISAKRLLPIARPAGYGRSAGAAAAARGA
jgi:hypothetical protein